MQVLEKHIEQKSIYAIKERWPGTEYRKMNGFGFRSWMDRMFLIPKGVVVFIEFKRPGGKLTKGQAFMITHLRGLGFHAFVAETTEQALRACEEAIRASQIPARIDKVHDQQARSRVVLRPRSGKNRSRL